MNASALQIETSQQFNICNIDESCLSLDGTEANKGGRPPMILYNPRIGVPDTCANKSGYHCTLVQGVNLAGEAFPPHLQLPTDALDHSNVRLEGSFFANLHEVKGRYGHEKEKTFPCTVGHNKKGGMDNDQFENYMINVLQKYFPNSADVPGKRVCVLTDGGPGRVQKGMLQQLRLLGIFLFPSGPPNTSHILQILDMLFGLLKTKFNENLETLTHERLTYHEENCDEKKSIGKKDLGLLLFGGSVSPRDDAPQLQNCIEIAFSKERIMNAWTKLGLHPVFNKKVLGSSP